jgi:predicted secreted protein
MTVDTHVDIYEATIAIDGTTINGVFPESIPFPKGKTGTKDTSTLGSGKTQKKGLKMFDPGSCTLTGNKISGDAGQIALWAAFKDRKEHTFTITIPEAGEVYTYQAYVSTNYPDQKDETYTFTVDLEVTGLPDLSTTYAGITSITVSNSAVHFPSTATSALPATANDVVTTVLTAVGSVTITPVAAGSSAIYVDGTLTASGATKTVTLGAANTVTVATVRVCETGKADRFVKVYIARA